MNTIYTISKDYVNVQHSEIQRLQKFFKDYRRKSALILSTT